MNPLQLLRLYETNRDASKRSYMYYSTHCILVAARWLIDRYILGFLVGWEATSATLRGGRIPQKPTKRCKVLGFAGGNVVWNAKTFVRSHWSCAPSLTFSSAQLFSMRLSPITKCSRFVHWVSRFCMIADSLQNSNDRISLMAALSTVWLPTVEFLTIAHPFLKTISGGEVSRLKRFGRSNFTGCYDCPLILRSCFAFSWHTSLSVSLSAILNVRWKKRL